MAPEVAKEQAPEMTKEEATAPKKAVAKKPAAKKVAPAKKQEAPAKEEKAPVAKRQRKKKPRLNRELNQKPLRKLKEDNNKWVKKEKLQG